MIPGTFEAAIYFVSNVEAGVAKTRLWDGQLTGTGYNFLQIFQTVCSSPGTGGCFLRDEATGRDSNHSP